MCWDLIGLLLLVRRFASRKQLSYLVSLFQKLLPNWNFINCYEIEISKHNIFYSAGPGHDSELKRSGKWNLWCNWNFGRLNSKKIKVCGNRETGERSNVVQSKLLFDFNPPCQSQCWPKSYNFGQKVTMLTNKLQFWPNSYNFGHKVTLSFIKPKFQFSLNPLYIVSSVSDSLWEVESASKLVSLQFILQLETLHLKNKLAKLRRCASRVSFGRKSLGPVNLNFRQVKPWHPWH